MKTKVFQVGIRDKSGKEKTFVSTGRDFEEVRTRLLATNKNSTIAFVIQS